VRLDGKIPISPEAQALAEPMLDSVRDAPVSRIFQAYGFLPPTSVAMYRAQPALTLVNYAAIAATLALSTYDIVQSTQPRVYLVVELGFVCIALLYGGLQWFVHNRVAGAMDLACRSVAWRDSSVQRVAAHCGE